MRKIARLVTGFPRLGNESGGFKEGNDERDQPWWDRDSLAARRFALEVRRAAIKAVRAYFQVEGFLEVETPALQVSPGIERHIQSFATTLREPSADTSVPRFLHTSPELAMKKLLAGGLEKIVQLCPVWRDGERRPLHHPVFTMLEWYRAGADYGAVMDDAQAVLRGVAKAAHRAIASDGLLRWRGQVCDPALPAVRLTVQEAFARYAGFDLLATVDDPAALMPPADNLQGRRSGGGHCRQRQ